MKRIEYAIIGGTGFYEISEISETVSIQTEYGHIDLEIIKNALLSK